MYVLSRQPNRGQDGFSMVGVLESGVDAVENLFGGQLDAVVGIFGLSLTVPVHSAHLSHIGMSGRAHRGRWGVRLLARDASQRTLLRNEPTTERRCPGGTALYHGEEREGQDERHATFGCRAIRRAP